MQAFNLNEAIGILSDMMKSGGITKQELLAEFPARPTNKAECTAIAGWIGRTSRERKAEAANKTVGINRPSPSTPQVVSYEGVAPLEKSGKAKSWRYALRDEVEGTVKFYRVKRGWKPGVFFVDVQASDDLYPIRNREHRDAILYAIARDPRAALALYGQEIGSCGRCGRTLTSEYRELGIGPVCIDK